MPSERQRLFATFSHNSTESLGAITQLKLRALLSRDIATPHPILFQQSLGANTALFFSNFVLKQQEKLKKLSGAA